MIGNGVGSFFLKVYPQYLEEVKQELKDRGYMYNVNYAFNQEMVDITVYIHVNLSDFTLKPTRD